MLSTWSGWPKQRRALAARSLPPPALQHRASTEYLPDLRRTDRPNRPLARKPYECRNAVRRGTECRRSAAACPRAAAAAAWRTVTMATKILSKPTSPLNCGGMSLRLAAGHSAVRLASPPAAPTQTPKRPTGAHGLRNSLDFGRIESHNPKERGGAATCGSRTRRVRLQWPRP